MNPDRLPTLAIPIVFLLAGCSHPTDVYKLDWTYGPGNFDRNDELNEPLFIGYFLSESDDNWTMNVTSEITAGTFELHMRNPMGAVDSVATEDGTYRFDGAKGRWTVEILTDADDRGFPAGTVSIRVTS